MQDCADDGAKALDQSMSPESGNRFRVNDMRKNKDVKRVA